jgi:hypothetical protein
MGEMLALNLLADLTEGRPVAAHLRDAAPAAVRGTVVTLDRGETHWVVAMYAVGLDNVDTEEVFTGNDLFQRLQHERPGAFPDGQLRTLQRRVKQWRQATVRQLVFVGHAAATGIACRRHCHPH